MASNKPYSVICHSPLGLTRSEVARQMGIAVSTVHAMRVRGDLHPQRDAGGVWHYDPAEVIRAAAIRGVTRVRTAGQTAALAFRMFEQGGGVREVVMALQITPEEVGGCIATSSPRLRRSRELQLGAPA